MRLPFAILGLALVVSSSLAQQTANAPETRSVIVNVFDRQGSPIRDLTKDNFVARVNGKAVEVLDTHYSAAPRRIVVLLDVSASMTEGDDAKAEKWPIAREALSDLLAQTPRGVPIAMLTFSNKVLDRFDFSQDRTGISKWLSQDHGRPPKLKHGERYTALLDAILEGLRILQPVQPGDALYAITDGGDNVSHISPSQAKAALVQSDARFYVLFTSATFIATVEEREGVDSLVEFADDSGGATFGDPLQSPYAQGYRERVRGYTEDVNARVSEFWTLQLAPPASNKPSKLKVEIKDHAGKLRNDVLLAYPRILPPAP